MEGIVEKVPFERASEEFINHLKVLNFSPRTAESYGINLRFFHDWLILKGSDDLSLVTRDTLSDYQGYLYRYLKRDGGRLAPATQMSRLIALTTFFRYLVEKRYLATDPTSGLKLPRIEKRLPREIMTQGEITKILEAPDTSTLLGVRDKAILELFYSTGIRLSECISLELGHVDLAERMLTIVRGKNAKDRVLPVGKLASFWLLRYLEDVRPHLLRRKGDSALFLTHRGGRFNKTGLNKMLRFHARNAGIKKKASSHAYRHAMATHMLRGKADIRYIQEMLGHKQLSTTQIYTRVEPRDLRRVHALHHPREKGRLPSRVASPDLMLWRRRESDRPPRRDHRRGGPFGKRVGSRGRGKRRR